ncbi:MAG: helix-turn-helix domain-containing protein [Pelagibacteraceae bacterium]|jgi:excisionase family DNA binding protein|nr:helix-turn-helix domain-containing protein [Pelagibacteraceae bacterium]MBT4959394.1 helix-turn-helix domain-containing protein [Flavobacteriaceae bacterium]MBT3902267.1 helix-turn-helix domain-containing protein [Pelagibacteraceae bacterium]MBT4644946.1 helix-turn-helix domain-containing protein [Pelagibacteraceae bacterium]MBT5214399.1 helix-turn-helix domain-containing protein [Pelagibacteraceae bacterium]|tara:strand:- start:1061 stop:1252 length:192 start_codon:yes stop_codon:yes gene_type:complete
MVQLQEFLTDKDLAKLLGISLDIVRSLRKRGKGIDYYRFGRNIRYHRDDVLKYINKNKHELQR